MHFAHFGRRTPACGGHRTPHVQHNFRAPQLQRERAPPRQAARTALPISAAVRLRIKRGMAASASAAADVAATAPLPLLRPHVAVTLREGLGNRMWQLAAAMAVAAAADGDASAPRDLRDPNRHASCDAETAALDGFVTRPLALLAGCRSSSVAAAEPAAEAAAAADGGAETGTQAAVVFQEPPAALHVSFLQPLAALAAAAGTCAAAPLVLRGWFQSPLYLAHASPHVSAALLAAWAPSDDDVAALDAVLPVPLARAAFVHVRAGDYTQLAMYNQRPAASGFYDAALHTLALPPCTPLLVLTNGDAAAVARAPWVRRAEARGHAVHVLDAAALSPRATLHVMAAAAHGGVGANSSLSWWGAWLRQARFGRDGSGGSVVVLPRHWYAPFGAPALACADAVAAGLPPQCRVRTLDVWTCAPHTLPRLAAQVFAPLPPPPHAAAAADPFAPPPSSSAAAAAAAAAENMPRALACGDDVLLSALDTLRRSSHVAAPLMVLQVRARAAEAAVPRRRRCSAAAAPATPLRAPLRALFRKLGEAGGGVAAAVPHPRDDDHDAARAAAALWARMVCRAPAVCFVAAPLAATATADDNEHALLPVLRRCARAVAAAAADAGVATPPRACMVPFVAADAAAAAPPTAALWPGAAVTSASGGSSSGAHAPSEVFVPPFGTGAVVAAAGACTAVPLAAALRALARVGAALHGGDEWYAAAWGGEEAEVVPIASLPHAPPPNAVVHVDAAHATPAAWFAALEAAQDYADSDAAVRVVHDVTALLPRAPCDGSRAAAEFDAPAPGNALLRLLALAVESGHDVVAQCCARHVLFLRAPRGVPRPLQPRPICRDASDAS